MAISSNKSSNMKDVAALAGVSIATVSRYLNGHLERMSHETSLRIKEAIEKLDYVPNSAARQMITKSSKMVAVVVANVDDYFSTELFKGISSVLENEGYIGVLFDSNSNLKREKQLLGTVDGYMFDGMILQSLATEAGFITNEMKRRIPVILVDHELELSPWTQVITNNYEVAQNTMKTFLNDGFSRVILLTSDINRYSNRRERYEGIKSVIDNIEVVEVTEKNYDHAAIMQRLVKLIQESKEKTLIFGLREHLLLEFVPTLFAQGYVDGKNVRATGFSDTGLLRKITPKIKLIDQDPYLIGATAAKNMVKELAGKNHKKIGKIVIPAQLK